MLKKECCIARKIAPIFTVSLVYEIIQYVFAIGASDITDLIGNALGGVIGIGIFFILPKIIEGKDVKILNILALIGIVGITEYGIIESTKLTVK